MVAKWPLLRGKSVFVLKCRTPEGKWVEIAELEERVNSVDAKDRFEEEIENNDCEKLKLEEYFVNRDGERIKYVKKHWERQLKKRRNINIDDILGATAFNFLQAIEACQKLQEFVRQAATPGGGDFLEMLKVIMALRGQLPLQTAKQQPAQSVDMKMVERVAEEMLKQQAEEFAETKPCPKCMEKVMGNEAGEGED